MDSEEAQSLQAEREARIRELEARAGKRRVGVRWTTALVAIVLAVGMFAYFRLDRDVAYFFSPREPITLGTEGDYHFDRLRSNRYAQIHGIPTRTGVFLREGDALYVLVGLQNTPLLVHRPALDTESDRPPTPVDARPFGIRGRLLHQDDAKDLSPVLSKMKLPEGVVPRDGKLWVLVESERPRQDASALLLSGILSAFVLLNLFFLVRDLKARRALKQQG